MLSTDELQRRLLRALDVAGNTHTPGDLAKAVDEGRMQSWQNGESVVLTELLGAPQGTVLNIFLVCGNLREVMEIQDAIADFARQHNCIRMTMRGRRGWEKFLPSYGWTNPGVTFDFPLND